MWKSEDWGISVPPKSDEGKYKNLLENISRNKLAFKTEEMKERLDSCKIVQVEDKTQIFKVNLEKEIKGDNVC